MRYDVDRVEQRVQQERAVDAGRFMRCAIEACRGGGSTADLFAAHYPYSSHVGLIREAGQVAIKGFVDPMTTILSGALVPGELSRSLIALSAPFAILPRLGAVPVPFFSRLPIQAAAIPGGWVDEARPKLIRAGSFTSTSLPPRVAATIVVVDAELTRFASVNAEPMLANLLSGGVAAFLDHEFCDPASPSSILAGSPLATVASGGNVAQDLASLLHVYPGAVETCTIIMSSRNAIGARLQNPDLCRDLSRQGGTIGGLPCVASDSAGSVLIAVDVARLLLADEGAFAIGVARETSIQMDDEPQGSPASGGTPMISMFHSDQIALRAERIVAWAMADATSVAYVSGVDYLASVGSPA